MYKIDRFTKNELNQKGIKLALLDINTLSRILGENPTAEDKIRAINLFKDSSIHPVLSHPLMGEWLNGLDKTKDLDKKSLIIHKYLEIMQVFDEVGAFWLDYYLAKYEIMYAFMSEPQPAYNIVRAFTKLLQGNYQYLKCIVDNELPEVIEEFRKGIDEIVTKTNRMHKKKIQLDIDSFNRFKVSIDKEPIKKALLEHMPIGYINFNGVIISDPVEYTYNQIYHSNRKMLDYAPCILTEDRFYYEINLRKEIDPFVKKGQEVNSLIDSLHGRTALSYCDLFITMDQDAGDICLKVINDIGLKVNVLRFNPKEYKFEEWKKTVKL